MLMHKGGRAMQWRKAQTADLPRIRASFTAELWYADAQRGVGRAAIQQARRIAGTRGAQYLQLFTLPVNTPAIRFYERIGFTRAAGIHEEVVDAALTLREYGFEIETADGKNKTETEL